MNSAKGRVRPSRGDVWTAKLDPTIGHEQGGVRPSLIVSEDILNRSPAGLVIVAPITGSDRGIVAHVRIPSGEGGLAKRSVILTDQVRAISIERLGRRLGGVSSATMAEVAERLRYLLGV
jgi:mRNA interferase MazF